MYKHDDDDDPTLTTLKSVYNAMTVAIWGIGGFCGLYAVLAIASYFLEG